MVEYLFTNELGGCGFESRCCHFKTELSNDADFLRMGRYP